MIDRNLLAAAAAALILSACATSPDGPAEPEQYEVRHEEERIVYTGKMSANAIEEVADLLEQHGDSIEWLDIDSPGGDVMLGLDLAELVLEHELNVRAINTGCHSTCANYVFTAGRKRVIEEGALVTWHGSALQRRWGFSTRLGLIFNSSIRQSFNEWKLRQKDFFGRIDVDERITIVGQDLECQCTWALSGEDMAQFGLENVEVSPDYLATDIPAIYPNMRFLDLPDDVFERIRPREYK
ncbi:MAG: hypothetical protein U5L08_15780 [Xanthomonadales bacterium]|nr:hypothetical protein [Xanthomonadales bacterium]